MRSPAYEFRTSGVGLKQLEEEHAKIYRLYLELDEAIVQAQGSPRILETASTLAQLMLLHFSHEEQFVTKMPFVISEGKRMVALRSGAEVSRIEAELRLGEIYAALHLRSLCKEWMSEHLHVESVGYDIAPMLDRAAPRRIQA